jgi:predicted phage-related endonuclease
MQIHDNLIQGSPEWHAFRDAHHGASEAPAVMGCSPYVTRNELLKQKATGIKREISSTTQALFDSGHRFEALERARAEDLIGDDLYPQVASNGKLSASFDGITFSKTTTWEHKTLNDEIRAATCGADLPLYLRVQMEHQFYVNEKAERCLFTASKWDGDGNLVEEVHHWYTPDLELREKILAAWAQFEVDLANYQHVEVLPPVVATPTIALPALSINVTGSIALQSNLTLFGEKLRHFIDKVDKNPSTDQAFADAEAAVKVFKNAEDALEAAESNALAQTASVDEMRRTVAMLKDLARNNRLSLEKVVKARKETIRIEIAAEAKDKFAEHIESLNKRLGHPYMPAIAADFAGAMKGLKTISSIRNAVDTEMARAKIEANEIADKLQANLETLRTMADDHKFLFSDVLQIVMKDNADLVLLIESRIAAHEKTKADEAEALRARIEAQERAKAEAAAAETLRIEREADEARRRQADAEARAQAESMAARAQAVLGAAQEVRLAEPTPVVPAQSSLLTAVSPSPAPVQSSALINLGMINAALGYTVSADFLATLGFVAQQEKSARRYRESDFPRICEEIAKHTIRQAQKPLQAAA